MTVLMVLHRRAHPVENQLLGRIFAHFGYAPAPGQGSDLGLRPGGRYHHVVAAWDTGWLVEIRGLVPINRLSAIESDAVSSVSPAFVQRQRGPSTVDGIQRLGGLAVGGFCVEHRRSQP